MAYRTRYQKSRQDAEKLACNEVVAKLALKHVLVKSDSTILALDDEHFQSTQSLELLETRVELAQHDTVIFKKMKEREPAYANVTLGDYSMLNCWRNVIVDHADFCCGLDKAIHTLIPRFRSGVYADKAILRLTVCARGSRDDTKKHLTDAKFYERMELSVNKLVNGTPYWIKPFTLEQIAQEMDMYSQENLGGCDMSTTVYTYGSRMHTMICLIHKVPEPPAEATLEPPAEATLEPPEHTVPRKRRTSLSRKARFPRFERVVTRSMTKTN